MDDTAPKPVKFHDPVLPVTQDDGQSPAPFVPQSPVSGGNKEHAPIASGPVERPQVADIRPSESEPALSQEVKEAGVEVVSERPAVSSQLQQAGVQPAKQFAAVTASSAPLHAPITHARAVEVQENNAFKWTDSIKWLTKLWLKEEKRTGGDIDQ